MRAGGRAEVSATAAYRYFSGRDALLAELADRAFAELAARFQAAIQGWCPARYANRVSLAATKIRALCHGCAERSLSGVRR